VTGRYTLPDGIHLCLEDLERSTVNEYGVTEPLASTETMHESRAIISTLERSLGDPQRDVEHVRQTHQRGFGGHEILEVTQQISFLVGGGALLTGTFALIARWLALGQGRKVILKYVSPEGSPVKIELSGFTEEGAIELIKHLMSNESGARPAAAIVSPKNKSMKRPRQWDIFLSYARGDSGATSARELHGHLLRLKPDAAVFFDAVSIPLGDEWDSELKAALESSRLVAALVSAATEDAYYQREEVAIAIRLARNNPAMQVVPVYLDEQSRESPPFGLTLPQSISVREAGGLEAVARELLRV
jgi:hypothetical protein